MKKLLMFFALLSLFSCKQQPKEESTLQSKNTKEVTEEIKPSVKSIKEKLQENGFKIFDYIDEETGDTVIMQQYFIAFLKKGPNRSQSKEEADSLQKLHLGHLGKMYKEGYADISGPFGDDGDIRGITIYNTPTQKMADSLANMDPMVKSGRLMIEIHPWWAAKGFPLR
ncbi:YciI family protein [Aquimarina macrocephali]|uniref:YciI family protein n=1 Tax=Aquimarina macrocephali TaxID=666563 RepID=UPI0004634DD3|nr:phenylalanyl-tRNA synthetase subunit alpha [Aquimarina macrocephali]